MILPSTGANFAAQDMHIKRAKKNALTKFSILEKIFTEVRWQEYDIKEDVTNDLYYITPGYLHFLDSARFYVKYYATSLKPRSHFAEYFSDCLR